MNDNDHMNKTNLITKGMPNYQSKYSSYNPIPHSAASVANFKSRPPEVSKERLDYEDSLFSDLAKDIKAVQIEENRKSEQFSRKIIVATLIVSIFTLLATIIGIFL